MRSGRERRGGELGLVACRRRRESDTGVCAWPSMVNVTVPVGVPWYDGAVTTAVKVTGWPTVDGFADDETAVCVAGNACDADGVGERRGIARRVSRCRRVETVRLGHREGAFARAVGIDRHVLDERLALLVAGRGGRRVGEDLDGIGQVRRPGERPRQRAGSPAPGVKRHDRRGPRGWPATVELDARRRVAEDRVVRDLVLLPAAYHVDPVAAVVGDHVPLTRVPCRRSVLPLAIER